MTHPVRAMSIQLDEANELLVQLKAEEEANEKHHQQMVSRRGVPVLFSKV